MADSVGARGVLALDAGQSGIRGTVYRDEEVSAPSRRPGLINDGTGLQQIAAAARSILTGGGPSADVVAIGMSGFTQRDDPQAVLDQVGDLGVRLVLVTHDSVTHYLGALGDRPGCVVAAGTGVVTLGVGHDAVARVDGWGYLIGNAGSGSWIGRRAMEAVLRAYDGRGPETALTESFRARYPDIESAYLTLAADPNRVTRLGEFAIDVARLAPSDAVAARISTEAGRELACSAATALRRVGLREQAVAVAAAGSVFRSQTVRAAFTRRLAELAAQAQVISPPGSPLDGAAGLPQVRSDSALFRYIKRAESASSR